MAKKIFLWFVVACGLFALFVCLVNTFMIGYASRFILTAGQAAALDADCVLVLGARVYEDGSLSAVLEDRMAVGVQLYQAGAGKKLLLSGDHGQRRYDEVGSMKAYAQNAGVPDDDIFLDHAGFSTYESAVRAAKVFGVKRCVVVTQSFHLTRAVTLLRAQGIEAYGVPSDLRPYKNHYYNEIRELGARVKDLFYMIFRPAPAYLGEPIDIGGSGAVTFD